MQADEAFDGEVRSHAAHRLQGLGERLLGSLLDRAHWSPPDLVATLIAEEVAYIGGRDVVIYLQDYDQLTLVPLPGDGLEDNGSEAIDGSFAGRAFSSDLPVERPEPDGVRLFLPMLDGSDRVGVLAYSLSAVGAADRQLAGWLAGLVANLIVTKGLYTDHFFLTRRRRPMRLEAEMQWHLLPPLTMETPQVGVAGILEPAYEVGGDSFDYALNDDILHVGMIDAMGHGREAAVMATLAVGAYRHARRSDVGLEDLYAAMDSAIADQFGPERFVTAQMARLDVSSGLLQWVNAGHPAPLLLRGGRVVDALESPTTLPVGVGGAKPIATERVLRRGDRVLFFTDGLVEEHKRGGDEFGETRLREFIERAEHDGGPVQETVRRLSRALMLERGGATTDDATLLLVEWKGGTIDHLALDSDARLSKP